VWEPWHIETLEAAAAAKGVQHPVHLKVDTGMGRLGVAVDQLPAVLAVLKAAKHLVLEGFSPPGVVRNHGRTFRHRAGARVRTRLSAWCAMRE